VCWGAKCVAVGKGLVDCYLTGAEISQVARGGLSSLAVDGYRVLVIISGG